jgi:hypothetical protein
MNKVPTPQDPGHDSSRWDVIRDAISSNSLTARFCLIWVVMIGVPAVVIWLVVTDSPVTGSTMAELLSHVLLPASLAVAIMVAPTYDISGRRQDHARGPAIPGALRSGALRSGA